VRHDVDVEFFPRDGLMEFALSMGLRMPA